MPLQFERDPNRAKDTSSGRPPLLKPFLASLNGARRILPDQSRVDLLGLQDGPAFRRSDPSRDIWFIYRLPIHYLTTVDK